MRGNNNNNKKRKPVSAAVGIQIVIDHARVPNRVQLRLFAKERDCKQNKKASEENAILFLSSCP